jgi:hypothetical protein
MINAGTVIKKMVTTFSVVGKDNNNNKYTKLHATDEKCDFKLFTSYAYVLPK